MFQPQQNHQRKPLRGPVVAVAALIARLALGVAPATAHREAGPAAVRVGHVGECLLQRVGTQYV